MWGGFGASYDVVNRYTPLGGYSGHAAWGAYLPTGDAKFDWFHSASPSNAQRYSCSISGDQLRSASSMTQIASLIQNSINTKIDDINNNQVPVGITQYHFDLQKPVYLGGATFPYYTGPVTVTWDAANNWFSMYNAGGASFPNAGNRLQQPADQTYDAGLLKSNRFFSPLSVTLPNKDITTLIVGGSNFVNYDNARHFLRFTNRNTDEFNNGWAVGTEWFNKVTQ